MIGKGILILIIVMFGIYLIGQMSVPSFDSIQEKANIAVSKVESQPTVAASKIEMPENSITVRRRRKKKRFPNPNTLRSEPDAVFCMTFSDINNLKTYMKQGDKIATAKLFDKGDCAIVEPQLHIYIMEERGDVVRVRREGMTKTLWTFRGALRLIHNLHLLGIGVCSCFPTNLV